MEHRMISFRRFAASLAAAPLLALVVLPGCYYDSEEELYPSGSNCDTTNVTFSGTIAPLIQANCIVCHSGSEPIGGFVLTDYATISAAAQIPAGQPGSLYGAISHDPGNTAMPQGGAQLPECDILRVKLWIDKGTPDN